MKILFILLALTGLALAQQQTYSPYSEYGVGELQDQALTKFQGMGGLGIGVSDRYHINTLNPASNAEVRFTTVDFSVQGRRQSFSSAKDNVIFNAGGLNSINFLFTKEHLAFAVTGGLQQYSRRGFEVRRLETLPTDTTTTTWVTEAIGSGGLNKFYLGSGWRMGRHLNTGVQFNYLFGSRENFYTTGFASYSANGVYQGVNTATRTRIQQRSNTQGLTLTLGGQYMGKLFSLDTILPDTINKARYQRRLQEKGAQTNYRIGLTLEAPLWAQQKNQNYMEGNSSGGYITPFDTLAGLDPVPVKLPLQMGVGFSIERNLRYTLGVDLQYQNWSTYAIDGVGQNLNNRLRLAVGGEWIPNRRVADINAAFYKRVAYRAGAYYDQTYLNFGDNRVNTLGLTMGLGLPLMRRSANRIDLMGQWSQTGSEDNGLVLENNLRLMIGISVTERWLKPRKYR